ncbi:sulfotransferase family protein [Amylibacter sp. SFDW26]|uniref:sulfotransferase family 2 domain-containing protein n=1 Tax=Amylibacter sp. SFDW26 TaxID=2652722 RepID=UPI00126249A7|nr:sulfotransferase family 2 domain-containing protein [Amylibacter sp. SFDW26]KAB7614317.1 sulfotransferase family protein [Amylibacter sp. SFDW26]
MISTDIAALRAISKPTLDRRYGISLMTTDEYPLYYRMITKCGCTTVINLIYYLHTGQQQQDPNAIHKNEDLVPKAEYVTNTQIRNSPYSFIVIRNPIKRFMSLYYDKLLSPTQRGKPNRIGKYFIENGLVDPNAGQDVDKHRENCINSIKWINKNLAGQTDQKKNFHWRPQTMRLKQVYSLNFNVLMLEDLNYQLIKTLSPLIPHIAEAIEAISAKNVSPKPVPADAILDDTLRQLITDTYSDDTKIYNEVAAYWRDQ